VNFLCYLIIFFVQINRSGIDTGGIFNDTLRIVFDQFSSYKNIERIGGNGKIFTDNIKKSINPFLLIDFCDDLQVSIFLI
jgi:hypothetical protein